MVENRSRCARAEEHTHAALRAEPLDGADLGGARRGREPYQGCVEVWFDNMEDYEATMASPEWKALEEDGPNGFEMAELHGGFVTEHIMRWDAQPDARMYTSAGEIPTP